MGRKGTSEQSVKGLVD